MRLAIYNRGDLHRMAFAAVRNSRIGAWVEDNIVVGAYQRWGLEPPYFDIRDWWVGYYRSANHHYVCLVPTIVIRCEREHLREQGREMRARIQAQEAAA